MFKKTLPAMAVVTASLFAGGCATHAVVEQAVVQKVNSEKFQNKAFSYEVLYSQPKPGMFTGGEQLPLTPIENAELSVASAKVLGRLNEVLRANLPDSVKLVDEQGDFSLHVAITARDKKGPAFADYDMAASIGKSLLTMGLGASEYTIIADFDVEYSLLNASNEVIHKNTFKVNEELDHEKGQWETNQVGDKLAEQLLEKHINLTLQQFLKAAATKA